MQKSENQEILRYGIQSSSMLQLTCVMSMVFVDNFTCGGLPWPLLLDVV